MGDELAGCRVVAAINFVCLRRGSFPMKIHKSLLFLRSIRINGLVRAPVRIRDLLS